MMLGKLYEMWGINNQTDFSLLGPKDYPVLSDLHALMEEEYQRVRSTEGGELYTPELLRSACLGLIPCVWELTPSSSMDIPTSSQTGWSFSMSRI